MVAFSLHDALMHWSLLGLLGVSHASGELQPYKAMHLKDQSSLYHASLARVGSRYYPFIVAFLERSVCDSQAGGRG